MVAQEGRLGEAGGRFGDFLCVQIVPIPPCLLLEWTQILYTQKIHQIYYLNFEVYSLGTLEEHLYFLLLLAIMFKQAADKKRPTNPPIE